MAEDRRDAVRRRSVKGAVHVRSMESGGVGRTLAGALDARRIARAAASRARLIALGQEEAPDA